MVRFGLLALFVTSVVAGTGCLPGDERPEPGSLLVSVQRSAPAADGFVTDDGWTVTFDRFVMAIGDMSLRGDECADYSRSRYDRLYDFAVAGTSKMALHYGLGHCEIRYGMGTPSPFSLLMDGVDEADRDFMAPDLEGLFEADDPQIPVGFIVIGQAERDDVTKKFNWLMRSSHRIRDCYAPGVDQTADESPTLSEIDLRAGEALERDLLVRPQELFRLTPSLASPIEFSRIALADADDDGEVTLEELGDVKVPVEPFIEDLLDELSERALESFSPLALQDVSLGDLVTRFLTARLVAFDGAGECTISGRSFSPD